MTAGLIPAVIAASTAITPTDDANIQGGSGANNNFGSEKTLIIRSDNHYRSAFLKFNISQIPADAKSVRLYVTCSGTVADESKLKLDYVPNDSWSENTITANNAPQEMSYLTESVYEGNKSYSFDITEKALSETDGILSLRLYYDDITSTNYAFKSKEADSDRPMIVYETAKELVLSQRGNLAENGDFADGMSGFSYEITSGGGTVSAENGALLVKLQNNSQAEVICDKIRVTEYEVYQWSAIVSGECTMSTVYYDEENNVLKSDAAAQVSVLGGGRRLYEERPAPEGAAYAEAVFSFTDSGTVNNLTVESKERYNILEPADRTLCGASGRYSAMYGERYAISATSSSDTAEIHISYYDINGTFLKNYIFSLQSGDNTLYAEVPFAAAFMSVSTNGESVSGLYLCKSCCNMLDDGGIELGEAFAQVKNIVSYTEDAKSGRYAAKLYANSSVTTQTVDMQGKCRLSLYVKGSCTASFADAVSGKILSSVQLNGADWQRGGCEAEFYGSVNIIISTQSGCTIDDLSLERVCERPRVLFGSGDIEFERWDSEPYYSCYQGLINRNGKVNNNDVNSITLRYLKNGEAEYMPRAARLIVSMLDSLVSQIPTYTSERMGRRMQTYAYYYDIVESGGFFSGYERACARNSLIRLANMQMSSEYGDYGNNNRNVDRYAGLAFVGAALPEFSLSEELIEHAKAYAISDLQGGVTAADGSWPETTRYVDVVVKTLSCLSRLLTRYDGTDLFQTEGFETMVRRFAEVCTTTDSFNAGGFVTAPAIGDALWGETNYGVLSWVAAEYKDTKPELSKQLMYIWKMGGARLDGGNVPYGLLFADASLPEEEPELKSTLQSDIGYAVLRNAKPLDNQDYFIVHAPQRNFYHRHSDAGGYSIYAYGEPVMLDAGVGAYDDTITQYNQTACHNTVSFIKDGVVQNGPSVGSEITEFTTSNTADRLSVSISDSNAESFVRKVIYLKGVMNSFIIYDSIKSDCISLSNLHMLTEDAQNDAERISGITKGGIGLDIDVLLPEEAYIEKQPDSPLSNKDSYTNTQEYFTVSGDAGQSYLMLINPYIDSGFEIETECAADGVHRYRVSCGGDFYYIILNDSDSEISIDLPELRNAVTGEAQPALSAKDICVMVEEEYITRLDDIGYICTNDGRTAEIELFNNTRKRLDGMAVAAQYEEGTMLDAKMSSFSVEPGADARLAFSFDRYAERLEVFLLRDMESLKPIGE